MKSGEVAKRLNIHPNTVREWSNQYTRFLSDGATARKRDYAERDLLVLGTIHQLREQGLQHYEVVAALEAGRLIDSVPALATPEEESARRQVGLVPVIQLDRALDRITSLESELNDLRAERDRAIQTWQADTTRLNDRIAALENQLGEARGKLGALESERRPADWWLRLVIPLVIGVVIIALIAVLLSSRGGA